MYKTIEDLGDLSGKVAMLRADLNVPMDENFHVTNTARIDRTVPTIKLLMDKGAKVVLIVSWLLTDEKGAEAFDYYGAFDENPRLSMLYDFLESIGYEMSEEERQLISGESEMYVKAVE